MNKLKLSGLVMVFLILLSLSFANTNESIIGNDVSNDVVDSDSSSLLPELLDYQENNAENDVQLGNDEVTIEVKKRRILADVSFVWKLIAGEFIILLELIKMLFYLIEVYVFILFFFNVIPKMFYKVKEVILKWYVEKE